MLSRISSNVLLKSVIAVMSAAVVIVLAAGAWTAWQDLATSSRLAKIANASAQTFRAMHNMRVIRSFTVRALESNASIDREQERMLAGFLMTATHALQLLIATLPHVDLVDGDAGVRRLERSLADLKALSDEAARNFHKPRQERRPGLTKEFDSMSSDFLAFLVDLDTRLAAEARNRDPFIDRMMGLKDVAWVVRSASGDVSVMVTNALRANQGLSAEGSEKIASLLGRADAGWELFERMRSGIELPNSVSIAANAAQEAIFGSEMVSMRSRVLSALKAGMPPVMEPNKWSSFTVPRLDRLTALAEGVLETAEMHAERQVSAARINLVGKGILFVAALALAIAGVLAVSRRVIDPLQRIQKAMMRVAEGDLSADVPFLGRTDEIGDLAKALATFRKHAGEKVRIEAEQQARRERSEARQSAIEQHIAAFERQIQDALRALTSASGEMQATSEKLFSTAGATDGQARNAALMSNETSANVQTVASAAEELTSSIAEISRQVAHAAAIAKRAVGETLETDAAVHSLTEAAKQIGQIVNLITAIAEQTNLLALNATIEAARAGEAGRGFTVVASEVKSLANQTAKATDDISAQVAAIQTIAVKAVDAMRRIGGTIGEVSTVATSIASAVEEQGAATHEITRNTQEAARRTQSVSEHITGVTAGADATGSAAEGVKKSAEVLGRETDTLRRRVDEFLANIRAA